MPEPLDIHPASEEERLAAYRNVHDVWSGGLSVEEHVRRRVQSVQHNRARWFVGCIDGRVVASLACYALEFRINSRVVAGVAIGSVHTSAEFRGRGLAPRLLAWVEADQRRDGAAISLLYSDIAPEYYGRLGYLRCPALEGWTLVANVEPRKATWGKAPGRLAPFDAEQHLPTMAAMYEAYHGDPNRGNSHRAKSHRGGAVLSIERSTDYWRYLLRKSPDDEFYWLAGPSDAPLAYARVRMTGDTLGINDYALARDDATLARRLYGAVVELARRRGVQRVGGWMPDSEAARAFFSLQPRATEITMVKPLVDLGELDKTALASTDRFCEIDHV